MELREHLERDCGQQDEMSHVVPRSRGVAHEPVGDAMELCEYFERHSGQQGDMSHVVLLSALRL